MGEDVSEGPSTCALPVRHPGEGRDPGRQRRSLRIVIPAKAGTHLDVAQRRRKGKSEMGSSFRWNDGETRKAHGPSNTLRAWVPAFAGMTA